VEEASSEAHLEEGVLVVSGKNKLGRIGEIDVRAEGVK